LKPDQAISKQYLDIMMHTCHPELLGGWDQEGHHSRPAQAIKKSLWDTIWKVTKAKMSGDGTTFA
jgi:hypothetical protein